MELDEHRTVGRSGLQISPLTQLEGTNAFDVLDMLRELAKSLDTSVAAVALATVRQQAPVTSTFIGMTLWPARRWPTGVRPATGSSLPRRHVRGAAPRRERTSCPAARGCAG